MLHELRTNTCALQHVILFTLIELVKLTGYGKFEISTSNFLFQLLIKLLIFYTQVYDRQCYKVGAVMIKKNFPGQKFQSHELWLKYFSSRS